MKNPIPKLIKVDGWKAQTIDESNQKLVRLMPTNKIELSAQYYLNKVPGAMEEIYVRETVAEKLKYAAFYLPEEIKLVIWDGWRPLEVQKSLFEGLFQEIKIKNPHLGEEDLINETQKFFSLPSDDPTKPSPHNTGGSVDVTLAYLNGNLLNMGTDFDEMVPRAATRFFEQKLEAGQELSSEKYEVLFNRRLLFSVMTKAGFTNYDEEWWHFDYGNQFWGKITGNKAFYGMINPK